MAKVNISIEIPQGKFDRVAVAFGRFFNPPTDPVTPATEAQVKQALENYLKGVVRDHETAAAKKQAETGVADLDLSGA